MKVATPRVPMRRAAAVSLGVVCLVLTLLCAPFAACDPTSPRDAATVVANWLALDDKPLGAALGRSLSGVQTYKDDNGTAIYYVVHVEPDGYAIVSADDLVEPIIAFSPEGDFDPSPGNPLYVLANRDLKSRIAYVRGRQDAELRRHKTYRPTGTEKASRDKWAALLKHQPVAETSAWTALTSVSDPRVDRLMFSKWSQTNECAISCYNYYTPPNAPGSAANYPSGCVATAMAQIMRFWQHPSAAVGTASFTISVCGSQQSRSLLGGDGAGGPYDWANMPLDPGCSTTTIQRQAIGALTHDAAVAVGTDFCSGGSGVDDLARVITALTDVFGFSNAKLTYNGDNQLPTDARLRAINPNLHAGHPVLLGIIGGTNGHVVICDGYGYNASTMYHHLNMGWGGSWNAWYNLPNIDSNPSFDTVAGVIYNIYQSGAGEIIAGRVTDSMGNAISGATVSAGSLTTTTNNRGVYALVGAASGTQYTVTVEKTGYTFTPQSVTTGISVNNTTSCGNVADVDFVAQLGAIDVDTTSLAIPEGGQSLFGVRLGTQPSGSVTVSVTRDSGDSDIAIDEGATLVFGPDNWEEYQVVVLSAAQDPDGIDGAAVIRCTATGWVGAEVGASEADDDRLILTDRGAVTVGEGSTASFGVKLAAQPSGNVTVQVARISGDADIGVQSGGTLVFSTSNWGDYQSVILEAASDPDMENGSAVVRCSAEGWVSKDVTAVEEDSSTPADTEPPTVPTNLTATAKSQTRVDVMWTASTDNVAVAGYKVYRDNHLLGTTTATGYSDTTCSANTRYSYSISAYDGTGNESAQCPAVSVTTFPYVDIIMDEQSAVFQGNWLDGQPATPPLAYEGDYKYTMTAPQDTSYVTWTPNLTKPGNWAVYIYYREGASRTTRAQYTVFYDGGSQLYQVDQTTRGGQWILLTTRPFKIGTSGYVKLANGTGETSRVVCADAVKFSFISSPPGSDTDPPSAPTGVTLVGASASRVDLTWQPSTDNVAVGGYKVYRNGSEIGTSLTATYSDLTCQPNTTYYYSVTAYDTSGNDSDRSTDLPVTTPAAVDIIVDDGAAIFSGSWQAVSGAPDSWEGDYRFAMSAQTEMATARWTPTIPDDGNYQIYVHYRAGDNRTVKAPYTVYYRGGSQRIEVNQRVNSGQWVYLTTKPFLAGTAGYVKLGNDTGETSMVIVADAVKFAYAGPLPDPPSAPMDVAPVVNDTTSITWKWTDVSNENGYRIKDAAGTLKSPNLPAGTTEWTETGLTPNTSYTRRAYAYNSYGESAGSAGQSRCTLARVGVSTDGTGATGNVWCTNATTHTWYGPGKAFTFSNPAGFGSGSVWKASRFEYKWNKSDSENWTTPGTSWTSGTVSLTPNAGDGYYYLHVRAFNEDNVPNNQNVCVYGPFMCDLSAPEAVTVTDEGQWTPSQTTLRASWTTASDTGSGTDHYEYAIGTTPATQDVRGWTSVGSDTSVVATGLSLMEGHDYYIQVRAVDSVGNASTAEAADGVTAAPLADPISAVWSFPNLVDGVSIRGKVATAAMTGAFWLEESDRSSAIKVISGATVSMGDIVNVAGVLGMSGSQRVLFADIVETQPGGTIPAPVAMAQRSLGGGPFNGATPGITGGQGVYNVGLLVKCWGVVTHSDSSDPNNAFFYIDDGSGLARGGYSGVLVRCGGASPPTSSIVSVTGVVGSESSGGQVVPVIFTRAATDIVAF